MTEEPAIPNQTTTAPWPTSLKITLNLSKRLFSPRFRCSPLGTSRHTLLCSCSQITAFNSNDSKQAILFDFPLDSNKPRFVFYEAVRVEKARQLCEAAAKRIDSADFLHVVHELLSNLAKICEGNATPDTKKKAGDTNLKPFRTDLLDNKSVCEELRTKICAPLNPSEARDHGLGYIYILRSQSYGTLAELKIGFSKHHPEHRAHQLAGCLRSPEVVAHSPLIPHANRIETIIHAELVSLRKTQFCAQCQRQHQEWFTISHIHARQVVTRWCRWVLSQPYRDGRLTSQWRDHLNKTDFNQHPASARVSRIWTEIIDSYPIDESMESADEQIALYVNAIFLEKNLRSICDLLQLPALKGNFADLMRIARVIRNRYGELGSSTVKMDRDFFYLFDSVVDFTRPRSSASKDSLTGDLSAFREGSELANYLGSIKTGCMSVSSPDLGVSESPMGDATLLPVVTLKELEHFNGQAKLGIGYNPTHIGFQFLQEAYQRDEWEGPLPRFKRPKGPRFFSASKPPSQHQQAKENSPSHKAPRKSNVTDAPSSYRMKEHELRSNQESLFTTTSPGAGSSRQKRKVQTAPPDYPDIEMSSGNSKAAITEVTYTPGEDGEKSRITFTAPLTDNLIDQVNKIQEEIKNGGRANVERRFNESLRYFGIETMAPFADDSTSEDEESSEEDDLFSPSQATPARNPSNQDKNGTRGIFSKNSVAKWFELS